MPPNKTTTLSPPQPDLQAEVDSLKTLVTHLNGVVAALQDQLNYKDALLVEANTWVGYYSVNVEPPLREEVAASGARIRELEARIAELEALLEPEPEPAPAPLSEPEPEPEAPPQGAPTPVPLPEPEPTPPPQPAPVSEPVPQPQPVPQPGPSSIVVNDLQLDATFNSIGIRLKGEYPPATDVGVVAYRRVVPDAEPWRGALPLWSVGDELNGSILLCEAGRAYEVRVTTPDGVVRTGTVRTRAEDIARAQTLTPTHYVRADGNDAADGRTPETAWRTLPATVQQAPAGAVVLVGPGRYLRPDTARALPLTLLAQYPAVDDSRNVINVRRQSIIDFGLATLPGQDAWRREGVTGPGYAGAPAGATYALWAAGPFDREPSSLAWSATEDGTPQRLARWDRKGAEMDTVEGWGEKLFTNHTYNHGWSSFRGADWRYTLYARLPGDVDPNTLYVSAGGFARSGRTSGAAFAIAGPDVRLSGFRIQHGEVYVGPTAQRALIDHNLLELAVVELGGSKPDTYGSDHVIERNRIVDTQVWTDDHLNKPAIPWGFIKSVVVNADRTGTSSRIGAAAERTAIKNGGGALRTVIRRNTIEGVFNGVGGNNSGYDRYAASNNDVYGNLFRCIADDALEPESHTINWRAWGNRMEDCCVVLSLGPVKSGPIYVFRNEGWRIGPAGAGRTIEGGIGPSGKGIKYSGGSVPPARVYFLCNALWTDDVGEGWGVSGAENSAGGGSSGEAFCLLNNIFRFTKYAFNTPSDPSRWLEDGNHFATTDQDRGLEYSGRKYRANVGEYRAESGGQGTQTNVAGDFITVRVVDEALVDPAGGDLRLRPGSALSGQGVAIPGLCDAGGDPGV